MSDVFDRVAPFAERARLHADTVQTQYRLTVLGALDHAIRVTDPITRRSRPMLCFDSNSYLGLHVHPRVVAAAARALRTYGIGTPSAQLMSNTTRPLVELEETVSAFHGRQDTLIFPSGYAANVGTLTALLRPADAVVKDVHCHASIHDGVRYARAVRGGSYAHRDVADARRRLAVDGDGARLICSDGVFSMHGTVAPLPELVRAARDAGARLLVDEAHATGIVGPRGRGLEDLFGMSGAIDVLVGTFSKAPGGVGGYVSGSKDLVSFLRFHARASVFTASLPAPVCAGLVAAFELMATDAEPRERLWANARRFHRGATALGLVRGPLESPIVPIAVGTDARLFEASRVLWRRGIKCGAARYPAVPRGAAALRFSLNARHTDEEIDRALEALDEARVVGDGRRVA